jgi:hypothetical protein
MYQQLWGYKVEEKLYLGVKVKSKAVPLHAMEALGGRGDIASTHANKKVEYH